MTKIFISHSSKDTDFAKQLADDLVKVGYDVWIDITNIRFGANWSSEVQRGLDECDAMLVVITPDSMASENVENEWQYYLDEQKPVFTIRYKPAKLHFQLNRKQYVDFHQQDFRTTFDEMCAKLQKLGFLTNAGQGEMHQIDSAKPTPPPRPAVASPPRIQGGAQARLPRVEDILPPPFEWCEIPAGKVTLEAGGYLKERTMFDVQAFMMAKYPITNAQYQVFVDAPDGYNYGKWWAFSNFAKAWRNAHVSPQSPAFGNIKDHPRTNLTWYEAVAFCQWLTKQIDASDTAITLPTEQQWQRAASGDIRREYPWGSNFTPARCNAMVGTTIGTTTPVNYYTDGASQYGVMDMSGNAWEWCLTIWENGNNELNAPGQRCSRGGSYYDSPEYSRVAYRRATDPEYFVDGMGFRICVPML